jgi:hypothetical protein
MMFRILSLFLIGLMSAGCQTNQQNLSSGALLYQLTASASGGAHNEALSPETMPEGYVCSHATIDYGHTNNRWETNSKHLWAVNEAKRRGLSCGMLSANIASTSTSPETNVTDLSALNSNRLCSEATIAGGWEIRPQYSAHVAEAKRRGLTCGVQSTTAASNQSSFETEAAQEIAALERRKREVLEQKLAKLEADRQSKQQAIAVDTQKPIIKITNASSDGPKGIIRGRVSDNTGIAEVRVDGQLAQVDSSGNFTGSTYIPEGGKAIIVEAIDLAGLSSSMSVRLDRLAANAATTIRFDRLNPLGRKVASNKDALALIIGVNEYAKTPAKANYADSDAQVFSDYAIQKLGISANRVKTLVNNSADESGMLLAVKRWLARATKQGKTDVYVFFAGHGLASEDGQKMYLLPYDGAPELLDKTAILRDELFQDIASANPRSVTVFLDTCYSGTTRGTDMLIASRPIAIKAIQKSVPKGFTVMTAAAGDQTAKPLEEAKHGMFSYFLMKGMEGDADANNDNQITAGELHQYVQQNVVQQSSGSQTPELQGDADRVLVRFQ